MNKPTAYVCGPMRNFPNFNFENFDAIEKYLVSRGWDVFSPAAYDRSRGLDETKAPELPAWFTLEDAMSRDLAEVASRDAIFCLPDWENSIGSCREVQVAIWCGNDIYQVQYYGQSPYILSYDYCQDVVKDTLG